MPLSPLAELPSAQSLTIVIKLRGAKADDRRIFKNMTQQLTSPAFLVRIQQVPSPTFQFFCQKNPMNNEFFENTGPSQAGGPGEARAPPLFGRSVNPISTRGAHYPHPVLRAPPDFQTLRRPCGDDLFTQLMRLSCWLE